MVFFGCHVDFSLDKVYANPKAKSSWAHERCSQRLLGLARFTAAHFLTDSISSSST
ncbi:hypothetical protein XFF6166_90016 [Xanthomonas citri pv. fuscans]|nr:hypothetical protein XFF6166_90016 [Xanthomonas citri pv. fuscans]SOO03972.1 hypothetical protein XFF6960_900004 [Xanthomonas citri pv. fuscans]